MALIDHGARDARAPAGPMARANEDEARQLASWPRLVQHNLRNGHSGRRRARGPRVGAAGANLLLVCLTALGASTLAPVVSTAQVPADAPDQIAAAQPWSRADQAARADQTSPAPAGANQPGPNQPNQLDKNQLDKSQLDGGQGGENQADGDDPASSPARNPARNVEPQPASAPEVSWKTVVPDILHDQKPIWMFPLHVLKGEHLKPTLILAGATAALVALDPYDEPYFRNSSGFRTFKTGPLRGRNTTLAITLAPAGLYLGGVAWKNSHAKTTALLAAEALADTQILSLGMKAIDGRLHPSDIPPHGDFTHTWFKYGGTVFNPGSFPSGHAISAFAVASVFSTRYRRHRWVPYVAYGTAAFIGLSRIPDQAHFPSDVFAGAMLGYAVSHFVILPRGSPDPSR